MPGVATDAGAWVLERLVLQAPHGETDGASVLEEPLAIRGNEMRHALATPDMPVQPEPSVHRVNHPVSAPLELEVRRAWHGDIRVGFAT